MSTLSPWSIKGVSKKARALAKRQAASEGMPLGQWLSKRIREQASQMVKEGEVQKNIVEVSTTPQADTSSYGTGNWPMAARG